MSRFIVVKKNELILYTILIVTVLCICITLIPMLRSSTAFSYNNSTLTSNDKYDLNGDGSLDSIITSEKNNNYFFKVKSPNEEYILKDDKNNIVTLDCNSTLDPKITYLDLNRNNIPEIIISGLKENKPTTYIFAWEDNSFKNILITEKNIVGVINSNNSKTPEVLYADSSKGDESTNGIIFANNITKDITKYNPKIPSLGVIQKFIDTIQLTYELDDAPGIFTATIPSKELSILWNLDKELCKYSFISGYFYDVTWNTNGTPTSINWILSFEKNKSENNSDSLSELTLYVKTELDSFGEYKISRIEK